MHLINDFTNSKIKEFIQRLSEKVAGRKINKVIYAHFYRRPEEHHTVVVSNNKFMIIPQDTHLETQVTEFSYTHVRKKTFLETLF